MRFDAPLNLWFLAAVPIVVLFYILKARRREHEVSSTFLWEDLLKDIEASRPWQKLRHNILMYLQILAVALLALGLARPVLLAGGTFGRSTVLLLDGSASMRATDVSPDRFSWASARAAEIISAMRPQDSVAIILVKEQPVPVVPMTREKRDALNGLSHAEPGYGAAAFDPAISLAKSMLAGRPAPRIVLLSDGGVDASDPALPSSIEFVHVPCGSERPSNTGIVSVGTRTGAQGVSVLVRVANYGISESQATVDISSGALAVGRRTVTIKPGTSESITLEGLGASPYVAAHVSSPGDSFAADDEAYAIMEGAGDLNILLVTAQNMFLERSLALRPGARVYITAPEDYAPSPRYSLYVFDGWVPDELPLAPVLVFNPPRAVGPITPGPLEKIARTLAPQSDHQIMKFVDLQGVAVNEGKKLTLGAGATPLLTAGAPLAAAWEGLTKGIVVGFDVHESNMPLKPCFPVFVCNALEWLVPPPIMPGEHVAGLPVDIAPPPWVERARISGPGNTAGRTLSLEAGRATFTPPLPGLYAIEMSAGDKMETRLFQARTPTSESNIVPTPVSLAGGETAGSIASGRPLWDYLAGLALVVLALEWWVYARGA